MKASDVKASQETIILATIADRLGAIMAWALGVDQPDPIAADLFGESYHGQAHSGGPDNVVSYDSPEEFLKARYGE